MTVLALRRVRSLHRGFQSRRMSRVDLPDVLQISVPTELTIPQSPQKKVWTFVEVQVASSKLEKEP